MDTGFAWGVSHQKRILKKKEFRDHFTFCFPKYKTNYWWPLDDFLIWHKMKFWESCLMKVVKKFDLLFPSALNALPQIFMCSWVLSRFSHVQLCDPMDYSSPGSSVHGILQAKILACPPPGDLLDPGIGPTSLLSPVLAGRSLPPGTGGTFVPFGDTRTTWDLYKFCLLSSFRF